MYRLSDRKHKITPSKKKHAFANDTCAFVVIVVLYSTIWIDMNEPNVESICHIITVFFVDVVPILAVDVARKYPKRLSIATYNLFAVIRRHFGC